MQSSPFEYQLDLSRQIVQASQVLANRLYPGLDLIPRRELEGHMGEWRIKNPQFGILETSIQGQDVSGILNDFAEKTYDLHCDFRIISPSSYDANEQRRLHYHWKFKPSDGTEGLGFNIKGPVGLQEDLELLESLVNNASPKLESLYLDGPEDIGRNKYHDENILLRMVENDPIQSLAVAYWLLEAVSKAEEIDKVKE